MPLNRERTSQLMRDRGVDALIASSLENVYYVSDYWSLRQQLQCGAQSYAILHLGGEPSIVAPIEEADLVAGSGTWIEDVSFYGTSNIEVAHSDEASEETKQLINLYKKTRTEADAVTALQKSLEKRKLTESVLALDTTRMPPMLYEAIRKRLPDAKIVEGGDMLREIRLIKTPQEVELIQRATEVTEKSMEDALEIARPDITELDLAGMFEYSLAYDGGRVTSALIGVGERSAFPNPIPSETAARGGDILRMTLGCTWRHYHANVSRTAVIVRPLPEYKKLWQAVLAAQDEALGLVKPGAKASGLHAAAEKKLKAAGLRPHCVHFGHGLGLECNEQPLVQAGNDMELKEGMVINVDVCHLELGAQGVQVEDTVLVTPKGHRLLTKTDRDLYIL